MAWRWPRPLFGSGRSYCWRRRPQVRTYADLRYRVGKTQIQDLIELLLWVPDACPIPTVVFGMIDGPGRGPRLATACWRGMYPLPMVCSRFTGAAMPVVGYSAPNPLRFERARREQKVRAYALPADSATLDYNG